MRGGGRVSSRRPDRRRHSSGIFVPRRLPVRERGSRHRFLGLFVEVCLPIFKGAGGTISHGGSGAARASSKAKSSELGIQAWIDGLCREVVRRLSAQRARRRGREWLHGSRSSPCWRTSWIRWRHELRRMKRGPRRSIASRRRRWSCRARPVITTGPGSGRLRARWSRGGCCHSRAHAVIGSLVISSGPLGLSPSGKITSGVGMSWNGA